MAWLKEASRGIPCFALSSIHSIPSLLCSFMSSIRWYTRIHERSFVDYHRSMISRFLRPDIAIDVNFDFGPTLISEFGIFEISFRNRNQRKVRPYTFKKTDVEMFQMVLRDFVKRANKVSSDRSRKPRCADGSICDSLIAEAQRVRYGAQDDPARSRAKPLLVNLVQYRTTGRRGRPRKSAISGAHELPFRSDRYSLRRDKCLERADSASSLRPVSFAPE